MSSSGSEAGDEPSVGHSAEGIEIEVPADLVHLSFVRAVVTAVAEDQPAMNGDRVHDLALVVTEATTNAIQAHQRAGVSEPVRVRCRAGRDSVTVVVNDRGHGFDPDDLPEMPPPESPERLKRESGLGLHLMRSLAAEPRIRSTAAGTQLRPVVRRSPAS